MTDTAPNVLAWQRLGDYDYRTSHQWLHDIFVNGQFIAITGLQDGTGTIISHVEPAGQTFWFLGLQIANQNSNPKEIEIQIDNDLIEHIDLPGDDSAHALLPIWGMVGNGTRAFQIKIVAGVTGNSQATLYGYHETSIKQELPVERG